MAVSAVRHWTVEDLEHLPDDGNKYEVVRGELLVTPAPSYWHQLIVARLARVLEPYVLEQNLGMVFQARSIVRRAGGEAEPDLYVSEVSEHRDWNDAPTPLLVVEVQSRSTRYRDERQKRAYYLEDVGIPEYWIVDRKSRSIRIARLGESDVVATTEMHWHPVGASEALQFGLPPLFE